jgi:L-iditol 2-dehydrogenase
MKALVLKGYRKLEYEDVPTPKAGVDDVLIKVEACGICGSDVHGYDGSTGRRIPPIIMGHEAAGVVAEIGSGVTLFRAGDRVTFDSTLYCGTCSFCRQGRINLCDNRRVLGVSCGDYRQHGAFAEYVAVPERIVYRLPDVIRHEQAAMVEAVSIAVHAIARTRIALNDTAVVVGSGMIGLLVIQATRAAGCGRIVAVDVDEDKLALAKGLGATDIVCASKADPTDAVLSMTGGHGADIVFEVVGVEDTVATAMACVRKGGQVTLVGNISPKVAFPLQAAVTREITMNGSCASSGEYPACLDLIARGIVKVDALISAVALLSEGAVWFERLYARERGLMKVILKP